MTGQVKEDILCRFGELGVAVSKGCLVFNPKLLRKEEFLKERETFEYRDLSGRLKQLTLAKESLAFTYCQVLIEYRLSDKTGLQIEFDNETVHSDVLELNAAHSKKVFERTGEIHKIIVHIN